MANDQLKVSVGPDSCLRWRVTIKMIAMKSLLSTSLVLLVLLGTSCKKEGTAKLNKISGDYIMYEWESSSTGIEALPNKDGEHGKIVITLQNDSIGTAQVLVYDKDNKVGVDEKVDFKAGKDADGDVVLVNKVGGGLVAYIWEDYDMDFVAWPGIRFSAKKK